RGRRAPGSPEIRPPAAAARPDRGPSGPGEEWYTAFVNITYAGAELHTEKTECGRYGEHSPKQDARGEVVMASSAHDRLACDPNTKFAVPTQGKNWIALIPKGNCTYRDKIRNAFLQNAAVVIFNVGSNTNETITMSHAGFQL
uniref:Ring finger protein 150 n=1 Tax=Loxodonta africana TaxID=9785 RepID=G3UL85_LOXAF